MKKIGFALVGFTVTIFFGIIVHLAQSKPADEVKDLVVSSLEIVTIENSNLNSTKRNRL